MHADADDAGAAVASDPEASAVRRVMTRNGCRRLARMNAPYGWVRALSIGISAAIIIRSTIYTSGGGFLVLILAYGGDILGEVHVERGAEAGAGGR